MLFYKKLTACTLYGLVRVPMDYCAGISFEGSGPNTEVIVTTNEYHGGCHFQGQIFVGDGVKQVISNFGPFKPVAGESIKNLVGMEFKFINPGTFMMGSPKRESGRDDNEVQHKVSLTKGFYMQTTEVTQDQWYAVMGSNPSGFSNCGGDCPVEAVSWNDAQQFVIALNEKENPQKYRLPTEAEWEYAARAGTTTAYGLYDFGNSPDQLTYYGWFGKNSGRKIHPVAQKKANKWGLYDMHGNVWEWCQDWKREYPASAQTDPLSPSSGWYRVYRGGSWDSNAGYCRSARRKGFTPDHRSRHIGFRLVLVPGQ
jgi:formylglycine-generating enzyme required for sulfatase activity